MSTAINATRRPLTDDDLVALDWKFRRMSVKQRSTVEALFVGCARELTDAGLSRWMLWTKLSTELSCLSWFRRGVFVRNTA